MLKARLNHPSHTVPSIVQIPKPLHKAKKYNHNDSSKKILVRSNFIDKNVSESVHIQKLQKANDKEKKDKKKFMRVISCGLTLQQNVIKLDDCSHENPEHFFKLKIQSTELSQLVGDTSEPILSTSEIKQSLICSTILPSTVTNRTQIRSASQIPLKQKPLINSQMLVSLSVAANKNNEALSLMQENQFLKIENERLKQISDERKNQISILLQQIMQLKVEMCQVFEDSSVVGVEVLKGQEQNQKQQDEFCVIERSLTDNRINNMIKKNEIQDKLGLNQVSLGDQKEGQTGTKCGKQNKENRKRIAEQISAKLRQLNQSS